MAMVATMRIWPEASAAARARARSASGCMGREPAGAKGLRSASPRLRPSGGERPSSPPFQPEAQPGASDAAGSCGNASEVRHSAPGWAARRGAGTCGA